MINIRICTPFYSEFESVKSGVRECLDYNEINFEFEPRQSGPMLYKVRNSFLNDAKSSLKIQTPLEKYSHFLFVDSDITFSLQHVLNILKLDSPISSCPYLTHKNDGKYHTGMFNENNPGMIKYHFTKHASGIKQVDYSGTGFFLIRRDVLCNMIYPWFEPIKLDLGHSAEIMGEDISFCVKAKQLGIPIFCDFDNPVKHKLRSSSDFNWNINSSD